ncbi:MAG: hypothetical protein ACOCX5_02025 [Chloroflexota bacterium]
MIGVMIAVVLVGVTLLLVGFGPIYAAYLEQSADQHQEPDSDNSPADL